MFFSSTLLTGLTLIENGRRTFSKKEAESEDARSAVMASFQNTYTFLSGSCFCKMRDQKMKDEETKNWKKWKNKNEEKSKAPFPCSCIFCSEERKLKKKISWQKNIIFVGFVTRD